MPTTVPTSPGRGGMGLKKGIGMELISVNILAFVVYFVAKVN